MKKLSIFMALGLFAAVSCSKTGDYVEVNTSGTRANVLAADSLTIGITRVDLGTTANLYSVAPNYQRSARISVEPCLIIAGENGTVFRIWNGITQPILNIPDPNTTIKDIRFGIGYSAATAFGVCSEGSIISTDNGNSWYPAWQTEDDYEVITATSDSRLYQTMWHWGGNPRGLSGVFTYSMTYDGHYGPYYHTYESTEVAKGQIMGIAGCHAGPVIVTDAGEVLTVDYGNRRSWALMPVPLTCVTMAAAEEMSERAVIGGEDGFLAFSDDESYESWTLVSSGINGTINSIASAYDHYWDHTPVIVVGGENGEFAYSVDNGETFTSMDIGFEGCNINKIAYFSEEDSFYAVGDNGKVVKISIRLPYL